MPCTHTGGPRYGLPLPNRGVHLKRRELWCPVCDGHGGSTMGGHCGNCEGTGINPDHPHFPA